MQNYPSCATYCLQETAHELDMFFDTIVTNAVLYNVYVDDYQISIDNEDVPLSLVKDFRALQ